MKSTNAAQVIIQALSQDRARKCLMPLARSANQRRAPNYLHRPPDRQRAAPETAKRKATTFAPAAEEKTQ